MKWPLKVVLFWANLDSDGEPILPIHKETYIGQDSTTLIHTPDGNTYNADVMSLTPLSSFGIKGVGDDILVYQRVSGKPGEMYKRNEKGVFTLDETIGAVGMEAIIPARSDHSNIPV